MGFKDFKIGWRLLLKEPGYSVAVVLGLSVGIAACFLLLGFVRYSFTYNAHLPDSESIFVVKERRNLLPRPEWRASAPAPLHDVAVGSGMPLSATRAKAYEVAVRVDSRVIPLAVHVVDTNYLDFFGVKAIDGDAAGVLARPDALVLNVATAEKLFGRADVVGKVVRIDGAPFEVRAILPDLPGNTTPVFNALLGPGVRSWNQAPPPERAWFTATRLYVKAGAKVDPAALTTLLQDAVTRHLDARLPPAFRERAPGGRPTEIGVVRLSDLYFDPELLRSRAGQQYGNIQTVLGMAGLAVLILVLACTNYINLAAVRTLQRQREIGVRKVLGAGGARLAGQFIAESLVVSMLATLMGLLLAWLAMPLFSELVNRKLTGMFAPAMCAGVLLLGVLVGVLSGLYPAWLALRLPVRDTLRGRANSESQGGMRLRRVLSVFQFGAAISLIGVTLVVAWQTDYASRADPGFDPAPLLVMNLPGEPGSSAIHAFETELARLPGVLGTAAVSEAIGRDGTTLTGLITRPDGATVNIELKRVGPDFFKVYQVRAAGGRLFDPAIDRPGSRDVILNALAATALGFDSPEAAIGRIIDTEYRVIGIAPDLRYRTLRQAPEPMIYQLDAAQSVLTVRIDGPASVIRSHIETLWQRHFPDKVPDIVTAASVFGENYTEDLRLAKILGAASMVAVALAAFGIYVLSAYTVRRRAREIVLRKVHGATGIDIGRLVMREFGTLIVIGALIGVPLAWLASERYLSAFVERAPMGQWPLLCALASVAFVALAATARHTLAAMRMTPAAALRD